MRRGGGHTGCGHRTPVTFGDEATCVQHVPHYKWDTRDVYCTVVLSRGCRGKEVIPAAVSSPSIACLTDSDGYFALKDTRISHKGGAVAHIKSRDDPCRISPRSLNFCAVVAVKEGLAGSES